MAINKVQDGNILRLTVGATVDSGDPVSVGNALRGVALTDYDAVDGKATVEIGHSVYDLSVQAVDDAGNSAVAIGDRLFFAGAATPFLSKKKSGKFFGIALETVDTGTTATINVLVGGAGADAASHQVFAAGIEVIPASPAPDTTTFIAVPGILATDVVIATMSVNGGSPKVNIISALAAASPAGITITTDVAPTAADAINWVVYRAAI
ncbi:MAG TPA: hypothetical protein DDY86_02590 [Syntrophaceae bacterium]|nr:hypothetical protein [Syntrophaceae bacterium]